MTNEARTPPATPATKPFQDVGIVPNDEIFPGHNELLKRLRIIALGGREILSRRTIG